MTTTTTNWQDQRIAAKKLIITAQDMGDGEASEPYFFPVFEFVNGAILVPSESTNDWFFDSREEIEPCGMAEIKAIEETDIVCEWDIDLLQSTIEDSESEFGCDAGKIKELI